MDFDKKKIIDKIKKCFALSASSNPHEAAVALSQAHALARKYNIENVDLLNENNIGVGEKLYACNQLSIPRYLVSLLNLISRIFNTKPLHIPVRITATRNESRIEFFGLPCDIAISEYAWTSLSRLLIKARAKFLEELTDKRIKRGDKSNRANLYALGWVQSVEKLVVNLGYNLSEEEKEKHFALIDSFMQSLYSNGFTKKPVKIYNNKVTASERDAFLKGCEDGKHVTLGRGLEPRQQGLLN